MLLRRASSGRIDQNVGQQTGIFPGLGVHEKRLDRFKERAVLLTGGA